MIKTESPVLYFDKIKNRSLRENLMRTIKCHWTHDSTALEGNLLTLGETDFILSEGLTISGKSLLHHQEVYGHAKAIDLIYQFIAKNEISENDIMALHKAILTQCVTDIYYPVGNWKNEPNSVVNVVNGSYIAHEYPYPEVIPILMAEWMAQLNEAHQETINSAFEAAQIYANLHAKFVAIHPFVDGNGRMARLLANIPLLRNGFPPITIPVQSRVDYMQSIFNITNPCGKVNLAKKITEIVNQLAINQFAIQCEKWWQPILNIASDYQKLDAEYIANKNNKHVDTIQNLSKNAENDIEFKYF